MRAEALCVGMVANSPNTGGETGEPSAARLDTVFALLSDARRRHVIATLDTSDPLGLSELAEAVARRERPGADPDPETVRQVEVALRHVHVPKLAAAEVVTHRDHGITLRPENADPLERWLASGTPERLESAPDRVR